MKRTTLIFALCTIFIIHPVCLAAEDQTQEATIRKELEEAQKEADKEQKREEAKHIDDRHAERINREIKALEEEVQNLAQSYREGTVWQRAADESGLNSRSKYKLLKFPLVVPSYVVRAATWPFAIAGDYLIKKGVVEKVVDVISNDARTFWVYPKVEMGFGSGFGGGLGLKHFNLFHKEYELSASYQIHVNLNQEAYASLKKDDAFHFAGHSIDFKAFTGFLHHYNDSYYGRGITAPNVNSIYGRDSQVSGGWLGHHFTEHLKLDWHTYLLWVMTNRGEGGVRKTSDVFPGPSIAGFNRKLLYLIYGPSLTHDNRDNNVAPQKGGVRTLSFLRNQGLGTQKFDYNEYRLSASQYLRAFMPRHVFVVRNEWVFQQLTGDTVPFFLLTKLDVNSQMRGYSYGRFSDKCRVVFNVEYRYPVWQFLDGLFFFDTGRVFRTPSDFSFKHFKYDGGLGLRIKTKNYFLMRFDVGYGGEGIKFLVKTQQAF